MAVLANSKGMRSLVVAIDSNSWTLSDYGENGEVQAAWRRSRVGRRHRIALSYKHRGSLVSLGASIASFWGFGEVGSSERSFS